MTPLFEFRVNLHSLKCIHEGLQYVLYAFPIVLKFGRHLGSSAVSQSKQELSLNHSQPHLSRLCPNFTWTLNKIYSTEVIPYWGFQRYDSRPLSEQRPRYAYWKENRLSRHLDYALECGALTCNRWLFERQYIHMSNIRIFWKIIRWCL